MEKRKLFTWTPRVLAILLTIFISIFAFDIFEEGYTPLELLAAAFMHLIPAFVLAGVTFLAWKNAQLGGYLFVALGFISLFVFHTYRELPSMLIITGIPIVVGVLFLLDKPSSKTTA